MNTKWWIGILLATVVGASAQTNSLTSLLQQGLMEEQASRDLSAAIVSYQKLASEFDQDRQLAATAVFRLGECYRALGKTNEAAAQYQRILRDFSDQHTLVTLSRQNLVGMGASTAVDLPAPGAGSELDAQRVAEARHQQQELLAKQIALAEQDLADRQKQMQAGKALPADIRSAERDVLRLKQQLAALEANGRINAPDLSGPATSEEDQEIARIQQMIQYSPDLINARENKVGGQTPLVKAAANGWLRGVQYLLDHGAQLDNAALLAATSAGHKAVVELLLERGADVNTRNGDKATPLHLAAEKGFVSVAEVLIQHHADLEARTQIMGRSFGHPEEPSWDSGETPLQRAVNLKQTAMVDLLLAKEVNINTTDDHGRTALALAAMNDNLPALQQLIKAGARLEIADQNNATALELAVARGNVECAKALLVAKANPNAGKAGAMLLAATRYPELVRALLAAGATPGTNESIVVSALSTPESLKLLLDAGANPNPKGGLVWAIYQGYEASAALLVQHGADVNSPGMNDMTPLMMAVWTQNLPILSMLLTNRVEINARHPSRRTALDMAKEAEQGSRPSEPGRYNGVFSPLSQPRELARKISELLRQHGALDKLPEWDRIVVTRPAWNYSDVVFSQETNDWNQFSLLELIYMAQRWKDDLKFPHLGNVVIVRAATNGMAFRRITVNLLNATNGIDVSRDVPLEFGDCVEIPEREHSLAERGGYLTDDQTRESLNYFRGQHSQAQLIVGQGAPVIVPLQPFDCVIVDVLPRAPALAALTSNSDLSQVKVTRKNPRTQKVETWVVDCRNQTSQNQLWLRNGDRIEVPLKP